MELLGTKNGSTPGPTAAKAEAAYNAHLAAQKEKVRIFPLVCFPGFQLVLVLLSFFLFDVAVVESLLWD